MERAATSQEQAELEAYGLLTALGAHGWDVEIYLLPKTEALIVRALKPETGIKLERHCQHVVDVALGIYGEARTLDLLLDRRTND